MKMITLEYNMTGKRNYIEDSRPDDASLTINDKESAFTVQMVFVNFFKDTVLQITDDTVNFLFLVAYDSFMREFKSCPQAIMVNEDIFKQNWGDLRCTIRMSARMAVILVDRNQYNPGNV